MSGTDPRPLTCMNEPGSGQYVGYSQALGIAFDPHNPRRFVAAISYDLETARVQVVFMTIGASGLG